MNGQIGNTKNYSIENANRFEWGSVSGKLHPQRVSILREYVVGSKVLDAGCGGGGYVDFFAREGFEAYGVDKYDFFLAKAREREWRGTFVQADLNGKLPFDDKTFDTTCCMDVLEHIDDRTAIRELARVTRKRLILAVPQEDQWFQRSGLVLYPYQDPTHLRYYTKESFRELANTVAPHSVGVFDQELIDVQWLSFRLLSPRSNKPGLTWIYKRLFKWLLCRCPKPQIYMNLYAIIDLQPNLKRTPWRWAIG